MSNLKVCLLFLYLYLYQITLYKLVTKKMVISRTTYNQNEDAYRLAELNYIKAHSASEEEEKEGRFNPLRIYAIIQRETGQADSTLENMLEKAHACEHTDFGKFVQEHSASIVCKVREQNASEQQNKRFDFLKHYKLVNKIGGVDID
jgi:hypothetical protein